MKKSFWEKPIRVQMVKGDGRYLKTGQIAYILSVTDAGGVWFCEEGATGRTSEPGEVAYLVSKTKNMSGGSLWFQESSVRPTARTKKK